MTKGTKVLVIGLFRSERNAGKVLYSAPEQLADLLKKNGVEVITTSTNINPGRRALDTARAILFNKRKYDVAIVPWFNGKGSYQWMELSTRLLKLVRKKTFLVLHGGGLPDEIDANPDKYRKTLEKVDKVICPSAFTASRLQKHEVKAEVIENPIELGKYPFQKKNSFKLSILWMRTLDDVYNPIMALEVGRILKSKGYKFNLVLAGKDNGLLGTLRERCKDYKIDKHITFPGLINHEQKLQYAKECDMYICTNKVDNAPVTLIEMMAFGLPIVSTDVGGIPYFIKDRDNGYLVADNDAESMAERLIEIHKNPNTGIRLADNGRYFSRRFDEPIVMEKWRKLL